MPDAETRLKIIAGDLTTKAIRSAADNLRKLGQDYSFKPREHNRLG